MDHEYPLLHAPRPWSAIRVGATDDARWRDIPKSTWVINMVRAQEMQQKARPKTKMKVDES